jgi:hypothetical protein
MKTVIQSYSKKEKILKILMMTNKNNAKKIVILPKKAAIPAMKVFLMKRE